MKTFTIICGLNDKDTKTQLIDTDTAERIANGLKKDLNQESIYFSIATAAVDFI